MAAAALGGALLAAACAGDGHELAPRYSGDPADFAWQLPDGWPAPSVPADNPMSPAKVELGRRLFYDVRLSKNRTQACATCHEQKRAFTDGRGRRMASFVMSVRPMVIATDSA